MLARRPAADAGTGLADRLCAQAGLHAMVQLRPFMIRKDLAPRVTQILRHNSFAITDASSAKWPVSAEKAWAAWPSIAL
jgi:hypothetical protein